MKAIELGSFGIDSLTLVEKPEPVLLPDQVLIQVEAVSLNYLDLLLIQGKYNVDLTFPHVPLSDGAGTVVKVGTEVTRWKKGDRVTVLFRQNWLSGLISVETDAVRVGVTSPGVFAQLVVLPQHGLVQTPDYLSSEEASTLPVAGLTAWVGLVEHGQLKIGQTVLVQGTGGVSMAALQLAKAAGARVIATTSSPEKEQKLIELGADAVINYRTAPDWESQVRMLTDDKGVDITLDVAGGDALKASLNAVKTNGFVGLVGFLEGPAASVNLLRPIRSALTIKGFGGGSRQSFEDYLQALTVNQIKPVIDQVFSMDQFKEAFQYLEKGGHLGKIVIRL